MERQWSPSLQAESLGLKYIVLDSWPPGFGASGRNAGFLIRGVAHNFAAAAREYGTEAATAMWALSEQNQEALKDAGAHSLPSYRALPSCLLALGDAEAEELFESAQRMRSAGIACSLIDSGHDDVWKARTHSRASAPQLGLVNPNDGAVNPFELLGLLRSRLPAHVLLSGAHASHIAAHPTEGDCVEVHVQGADQPLQARQVLVATNAFAPQLLPQLEGVVTPNRAQMLSATARDAEPARLDYSYYADFGDKYFRPGPDGGLLVGGCRRQFAEGEATTDPSPTEQVQAALLDFAGDIVGKPLQQTGAWAGTMGFSPDGLPLVGPVGPTQTHSGVDADAATQMSSPRLGSAKNGAAAPGGGVWFAGGFTGHGMSLGYVTGGLAVDAMWGDGEAAVPQHLKLSRIGTA